MKKLLAIICVLLIIFIGMYAYKSNKNKNIVNISEVQQIEEYISKIYMWKEITDEALPKFDDINNAPDLWVWEVVKKDLENYELSYEEIQEKAVQIFGNNFKKQFPKEGTEYIYYDDKIGKYLTSGIDLDVQDDMFFIKDISKNKDGYEVDIVEYLEDYSEAVSSEIRIDENQEEEENLDENHEKIYNVYIRNLNQDIIDTIKSNENETRAIEVVKENIDKFTTKKVKLTKDFYVESVQ